MAESVWQAGKLRAVYQPAGRRINGEARYRRANFDVLEWTPPGASQSSSYVLPLGTVRVVAGEMNISATNGDGDSQFGQEFGYYEPEILVVDLHEGGGQGDTWKDLHSFGYV